MKRKHIALLVAVGFFAGVVALVISNIFLAAPQNLKQDVEVVEPISTEFNIPSERYFNGGSINPTRLIHISESQNQNPFE